MKCIHTYSSINPSVHSNSQIRVLSWKSEDTRMHSRMKANERVRTTAIERNAKGGGRVKERKGNRNSMPKWPIFNTLLISTADTFDNHFTFFIDWTMKRCAHRKRQRQQKKNRFYSQKLTHTHTQALKYTNDALCTNDSNGNDKKTTTTKI